MKCLNIDECKKYCFTKTGKIKRKYLIPEFVKNFLLQNLDYSNSLDECIYRIKNNDYNIHYCPVCHKKLKYIISKKCFQNHCSLKCAATDEKTRNKWKQTLLNIYGENYKEVIYKKGEETRLAKYGSKSFLGTKDCLVKSKETKAKRYGDENYNNRIKQSITMKTKYKSTDIKEKIKNTIKSKYGVDSFLSSEYINSIRNNNDIQSKIIDTKRKNKTFNTSKEEEEFFAYIISKFPNVKRQYSQDVRYPFACDFYIPELDIFIELQRSWTHGGHPYNPNSLEDQIKLGQWKSKRKKYYDNAIDTWTRRDVNKRNQAKNQNLYFKEIWNLDEGKSFIDSISNYDKGVSTIPDECKGVESEISTDSEREASVHKYIMNLGTYSQSC